ncbi:MAG: PilN domain-containing protein [Sulfitobacter sp.]
MSVSKGGLAVAENSLTRKFAMQFHHLAKPILRQSARFMPDWLMAPNLGFIKTQQIYVDQMALTDFSQIKVNRNAVVDVWVARECFLKKNIPVPPAAAAHGTEVVDVFLRQSLPGNGQGMVWRSGAIAQLGQTGAVTAYVLKSTVLDRLAAHVAQNGGQLRQVRVQDDDQVARFVDHRALVNRPARIWIGIALVGYVGVCGVLAAQTYQRLVGAEQQVAALQMKRAGLADEAAALVNVAQSNDAAVGAQQHDLAVFLTRSGRSQILANLTALVPDDIWLSEFSLNGNELRVSGRTQSDVVGLISTVQAADWVNRAKLDGPVMQFGFEQGNGFELLVEIDPQMVWGSK